MNFAPYTTPFPSWLGPYTPARGTTSGFRVKNGKLGAWVYSDEGGQFWSANQTSGTERLEKLVKQHWRGGRIMFLPCGYVVKPLQDEDERGMRVVIGEYKGEFLLSYGREKIDFSQGSEFVPGSEWSGPKSIGLECTFRIDGSISTNWYQPSDFGREEYTERIAEADKEFISIFRRVRPYDSIGRVRLTIGGHVITNKETPGGWKSFYVGRLDTSQFRDWERYLRRK